MLTKSLVVEKAFLMKKVGGCTSRLVYTDVVQIGPFLLIAIMEGSTSGRLSADRFKEPIRAESLVCICGVVSASVAPPDAVGPDLS
jgi:hypothetical protein